MSQIERTISFLAKAEPGCFVENKDNGRAIEVACMTGGRYLCKDEKGEPAKQTNSPCEAYMYLAGIPGIEEVAR